jgi:Adenine-specific methyltransferase EcoRI
MTPTEKQPLNRSLHIARSEKQDEFYTQYADIQKEVTAYTDFNPNAFRGKIVYCNCDDPFESNFFKYFAANFNRLGLKKLITTSYDGSPIAGGQLTFGEYTEGNSDRQKPKAIAIEVEQVTDLNGDGSVGIDDVKLFLEQNPHNRTTLIGGGDFRSAECIELLKQADIVATNPPFSLFREFVTQLVEHKKKFLIVGSKNAITYKEIFPLIRNSTLWLGAGFANGNAYFSIPNSANRDFAHGVYDPTTGLVKFRNVGWFTNIDHGRRHERLPLMTMADNLRFSKHKEIKNKSAYDHYDNYDAIEVPFTDAIPSDYTGAMGVPITFLDRYNPEQFEILGITDRENNSGLKTKDYTAADAPKYGDLNRRGVVRVGNEYKLIYARLIIRHRLQNETTK